MMTNTKIKLIFQFISFLVFLFTLNIILIAKPFLIKNIYPYFTQVDHLGWSIEEQTRQAELIAQQLNSSVQFQNVSLSANAVSLTDKEISHMNDVRHVFFELKITALVFFIILVIRLAQYSNQKKLTIQIIQTFLKKSLLMYSVTSVTLTIFMGVAWNFFFTTLHEVFFPRGNWSFPADSTLIRLFPELFWQRTSILIILLPLIELGLPLFILQFFKKSK